MLARSIHRLLFACLLALLVCSCTRPRLPRVLKIGLVAPFEGRYRDVGYDAVYAARLAVREINAAGGIDGWHLELVAYDDRAEAGLAAQAARNLAVDADVAVVLGHFRPETSTAAAAIYRQAGVPLIIIGEGGENDADGVWHLVPTPQSWGQALLRAGDALSPVTRSVWGAGPLADAVVRASEAQGAVQLRQGEPVRGSELVFCFLPPVEAGECAGRWRMQGWGGPLIGDLDMASPAFAKVAGTAARGAQFVTPYPYPQDVAGTSSWIADYASIGPHVPPPGPYALPTYEAVQLVASAVRAVIGQDETPGRQTVLSALSNAHHMGWLGEIAWDAQGYWREAPLYLYQWAESGPQFDRQLP